MSVWSHCVKLSALIFNKWRKIITESDTTDITKQQVLPVQKKQIISYTVAKQKCEKLVKPTMDFFSQIRTTAVLTQLLLRPSCYKQLKCTTNGKKVKNTRNTCTILHTELVNHSKTTSSDTKRLKTITTRTSSALSVLHWHWHQDHSHDAQHPITENSTPIKINAIQKSKSTKDNTWHTLVMECSAQTHNTYIHEVSTLYKTRMCRLCTVWRFFGKL